MHCGKLSHALGKFDDAISCRGEYFLAPIDQHVQVDVDVINETDAIVLIRPGTRIGILNFININNETADAPLLQDEYGIFAEFNPVNVNPEDRQTYANDGPNGTSLKADIAIEMHMPAVTTASISTGLTIAVPSGLEAQARASSSLPDGLLVQRLRAAAIGERQEITVVVSNVGTEVITVRPGDMIAQQIGRAHV